MGQRSALANSPGLATLYVNGIRAAADAPFLYAPPVSKRLKCDINHRTSSEPSAVSWHLGNLYVLQKYCDASMAFSTYVASPNLGMSHSCILIEFLLSSAITFLGNMLVLLSEGFTM
jgi:hypothetical protein